jgi:hypothetical protein
MLARRRQKCVRRHCSDRPLGPGGKQAAVRSHTKASRPCGSGRKTENGDDCHVHGPSSRGASCGLSSCVVRRRRVDRHCGMRAYKVAVGRTAARISSEWRIFHVTDLGRFGPVRWLGWVLGGEWLPNSSAGAPCFWMIDLQRLSSASPCAGWRVSPRLFCRRTYVITAAGRCALTLRAAINASSASTMSWPVSPCSLKPTANCTSTRPFPRSSPEQYR